MPTVRYMQEEYFPRQQESFPAFTAETGIGVQADFLPVDPFWHDARTGLGTLPMWDLLVPDEVIVAEQMAKGALQPLGDWAVRDNLDLSDWLPAGVDRFRHEGNLYAIPYVAMSNVLIYRADLLQRYDIAVPTTWEELCRAASAAQAALRNDGVEDVAGFTSRGLAGYGHNFWIIGSTLFPSWGWEWNRGPGNPPSVHSVETVEALSLYASLLREAGPPGSDRLTFTDTHRLYAQGKAVFLIDAATELATMRREGSQNTGNLSAMTVVPAGPTGRPEPGLYSPAYCIPASSARKDEAWQLLRFLASVDEVRKDTLDGGYAEPARMSVFESTDYRGSFGAGFHDVLVETRKLARINRPLIPYGFDLGEIVGAAAEEVIAGRRRASEALLAAQKQIDALRWTI